MQEFQQRVVAEKTELDEKVSRLKSFCTGEKFRDLPPGEQERLVRQLGIMREYSDILRERITAFSQ